MKKYTLEEWAIYQQLTFEEVYEPDIAFIYEDANKIYKQLLSTGELVEVD